MEQNFKPGLVLHQMKVDVAFVPWVCTAEGPGIPSGMVFVFLYPIITINMEHSTIAIISELKKICQYFLFR